MKRDFINMPAVNLARLQAQAKRDGLALAMYQQMRAVGLEPEREHKFHQTRKWRFDFAFPARLVALEVDGGTFSGGRHTRGNGYAEDCVKLAEAGILGWRVLRATSQQVKSGQALGWVERILK